MQTYKQNKYCKEAFLLEKLQKKYNNKRKYVIVRSLLCHRKGIA